MIDAGAGAPAGSPPVAVLLGGPSAEHDVSIVSGSAIAGGLLAAGFAVQQILVDLQGGWWWLPTDHRRSDRPPSVYDDPVALGANGPLSAGVAIDLLGVADPRPIVFIALHGPFGEDGTVQALLEGAGIAYTGSGVTASAVGMDKALFKRLARGVGLPVVDWREVQASRWASNRNGVLLELEGFSRGSDDPRLMIKPARLGSSVGMTLVHDPSELPDALEAAFAHDTLALAELYLPDAREIEVGVLGNDPEKLVTFGPGEIFPGREFYDYVAKYTPHVSRTTPAAELSPGLVGQTRRLALAAYRAIGAEGFGRVDFLVVGDTPHVSEINTIPGFTPISLFPAMAARAGHDFPALCTRIVGLGLERHAARIRRRLTPADLPR